MNEITWKCHVCGRIRPDNYISVLQKDISKKCGLPFGTVQENIRYCNDNSDCINGAKDVTFFKKKEK